MAVHIRAVEDVPDEEALPTDALPAPSAGNGAAQGQTPNPHPGGHAVASAAVSRETEIVGALQILNGRLQAVEKVISDVPKAATLLRALLAAFGVRVLQTVALIGCLGLAASAAYQPSWQGAGILGMVIAGVYLPLAALAYWGNRA